MNLRQSARNARISKFNYSGGYPDGPSVTPLEQLISHLDKQSFPASVYAEVDDILVFSLFCRKRRPHAYRSLKLDQVFLEEKPLVPSDVALDICRTYNRHADASTDSAAIAKAVADEIATRHQDLFVHKDSKKIIVHLLGRYHAMQHHPESQISLDKVQFQGSGSAKITAGLRAKTYIGAGTVILTTCSSMSSDTVDQPSLSTIESVSGQLGPSGPRVILGPFRFANHHCNPNSQITPIPGTHAFAICAIRDIETGEPVTVKYSGDSSYFLDGQCGCDSCKPDHPPLAPRRPIDLTKFVKDPNKKITRRGGRRARTRRVNRLKGTDQV